MRSERLQKKKYEREYARRTRQLMERALLTICLAILLIMGSSAILSKATTKNEAERVYYKYYKQIEIQSGDSLWTIAGQYMQHGPYESRKEYMEEIAELNQLTSTTIITGQHLVVPYYDDTYK